MSNWGHLRLQDACQMGTSWQPDSFSAACQTPNDEPEPMQHAKSQSGQKIFMSTCYTDHQMSDAHGSGTQCQQHCYLCTCRHAVLSCVPVLLSQVMRSKLTPQTQPSPAVSSSSRADMLLRCRGMFAASLQQVHAATGELHNLQRVMRFHATREDVAWAALSEMQPCTTICNAKLACRNLLGAVSRHI